MDEALPVNDACSCASKAFPQTHTKNVISPPPPPPFTSAYLCSFFQCTCFNVGSWNLGNLHTNRLPTHHWQPAMGPRWFVSFERHLRSQSVFLVWSRTTSRCFEVWSLTGINYTGIQGSTNSTSFLMRFNNPDCPTQKSTCVKQIVGFFLMIRLLFWGSTIHLLRMGPSFQWLPKILPLTPSVTWRGTDPTPGGPWIWNRRPLPFEGFQSEKKQTCEGVQVHTKYTYLYTYTVYMV